MTPRPRSLLTLAAAALIAAAASCSRSADTAVPRPTAYPRIDIYPASYSPVGSFPVHLELNSACTVTVDSLRPDGTAWLTASYPAYGASTRLYITVSPADSTVAANRSERMALNTGGSPTELTELTSPGGYRSTVALTPSGSATPVQILSVGDSHIVSGALFLESAASAPDSVRPIVEAVRDDLIHAAQTLR